MATGQLNLRRTPLFETHREADARLVPFSGWEMPVEFDGIREEHVAVRTHAGMFDVSHMGQIEIEGPEAERFLQRLLTNDVSALEPGRGQYSLLLDEQGGILDDLILYRLGGDRFLAVTNAANHSADLAQFGAVSRSYDVFVRDVSAEHAMLAVQGPNARSIVSARLGIALPDRLGVLGEKVGGRAALVCGTGYTGEDGVELLISPDVAPAIWAELVDAAVVPCGLGARDTLRLEACFPLHGNDISADIDPISAGLGWACREETGFVGHEVVTRMRRDGPPRRLVPFVVEGRGIARQGDQVIRGDQEVGRVTSGTFSPSLEHGIGMAYVDAPLAEVGTELEVDVRGRRRVVRVTSKPIHSKGS